MRAGHAWQIRHGILLARYGAASVRVRAIESPLTQEAYDREWTNMRHAATRERISQLSAEANAKLARLQQQKATMHDRTAFADIINRNYQ